MAWFPAALLKPMALISCATMMRGRFAYARRRYASMVELRHGFATLNSNNFAVYGQKQQNVGTVFFVRSTGTF